MPSLHTTNTTAINDKSSSVDTAPQQQASNTKDASLVRNSTVATGVKTPQEYPEFIKQALILIEKKVRNLEKRRTKLDEYKDMQKSGDQLNDDQLMAVSKYEEVKTCLELVKELDKQLVGFVNDALKAQKKQSKKEQLEREELVKEKLKEAQKFQAVLNTFGDEKIRQDFLDGKYGIDPITKEELELLDEFDKIANTHLSKTYENELNEAVDHYLNLIEGKNKAVLNTTYAELRKLFERILTSKYWSDETLKQQEYQQQTNQQNEEQEQQKQSNVNTSTDDYVIVSGNELEVNQLDQQNNEQQLTQENTQNDENTVTQTDLPLETQQPQDHTTFFTTLNRPDLHLKEFLNENNEGINFLQDSQIYPQNTQLRDHQNNQFSQQKQLNQNNNQQEYDSNVVYNNQKIVQKEYENENTSSNNQYGFGKREDNGFSKREDNGFQRNNSGQQGYRRSYNDNNDKRGGRGGSYSDGRGRGRGGFRGGNGYRGARNPGTYRNPGQTYNKNNQQAESNDN